LGKTLVTPGARILPHRRISSSFSPAQARPPYSEPYRPGSLRPATRTAPS